MTPQTSRSSIGPRRGGVARSWPTFVQPYGAASESRALARTTPWHDGDLLLEPVVPKPQLPPDDHRYPRSVRPARRREEGAFHAAEQRLLKRLHLEVAGHEVHGLRDHMPGCVHHHIEGHHPVAVVLHLEAVWYQTFERL